MKSFPWQSRMLPLTVMVIALLFAEKAVVLAGEITAKGPAPVAGSVDPAAPGSMPMPSQPSQPSQHATALSAASPAAMKPPSAAELQLLQDLRTRKDTLDTRERRLDQRDELLQAAELKLQAKLDDLTTLQKQLEKADDARRERDGANWGGLVRMYEDMKPRDAAAIFNVLDMSVLLEVLDRMDERKAAAVLSNMLPERARLATQMLAVKRTRQNNALPSAVVSSAADQHT